MDLGPRAAELNSRRPTVSANMRCESGQPVSLPAVSNTRDCVLGATA